MPRGALRLPAVQPRAGTCPQACPRCGGGVLQRHQACPKPVRDPHLAAVQVVRYRCTACAHTFRHDPEGVTCADQSERLVVLAAVLWALGLSHARVALVLRLFGVALGRMSVWRAVQVLGQCWLGMRGAQERHRGPLPPAVRRRRLVQRLARDWPSYRVWAERADVPATNNRTEQAIGRLKVRRRTVRGYKSAEGLLNGSMLAAAVSGPGMPDVVALLSAS